MTGVTGTALVSAADFAAAIPAPEGTNLPATEFRAFKYSEVLNCVFIQRGPNVLILPAFKRADGSVFIDKELGFRSLRKVLGPERMELVRRALAGEDTSGFEHLGPAVDPDAPMTIVPLGDA